MMPCFGPAAFDAIWSATFNFIRGRNEPATKPQVRSRRRPAAAGTLRLRLAIDRFCWRSAKETTQRANCFPTAIGQRPHLLRWSVFAPLHRAVRWFGPSVDICWRRGRIRIAVSSFPALGAVTFTSSHVMHQDTHREFAA